MSTTTTAPELTQPVITHEPIPGILHKVDKRAITERIESLRTQSRTMAPEEIHLLLNASTIEKSAEERFSAPAQHCLFLRNLFVLLPLIWTWISLGMAASGFAESVHANSSNQEFTIQSFLYLWAQGFPDASTSHPRFEEMVQIDTLLFSVIIALTLIAYLLEMRGKSHVATIHKFLQKEVDALCAESEVRSLGPGAENKKPLWAVEVHTAITELKAALADVRGTLRSSSDNFRNTIQSFTSSYEKQDQRIGEFISSAGGVYKAIGELNAIYQAGKETYQNLDKLLPRMAAQFDHVAQAQDQSNQLLQNATHHIGNTASAITQLARPFIAADLAAIATQTASNAQHISTQQQAVIEKLAQITTTLDQLSKTNSSNTVATSKRSWFSNWWPWKNTSKQKVKKKK